MGVVRTWLAKNQSIRLARDQILLATSYWSDWNRFRTNSGMADGGSRGLHARIVMDAHRLEKGLALPAPRVWFGEEVIERLLANLEVHCAQDSTSETDTYIRDSAVGALQEYFTFHDARSGSAPVWVDSARIRAAMLRSAHPPRATASVGGVCEIGPSAIESSQVTATTFDRFVRSRHSVRNYSTESATLSTLESAIALAGTSPSVCNRQGSRVRIFTRGSEADAVLSHQNGNSGFGHTASHAVLITQDIQSFVTPGERNQAFIDGGMFAMTLLYALHAAGVATCALNWSRTSADDRRFRQAIGLPDHEIVIMAMTVGYAASETVVTRSPLRPDIVRYPVQ